MRITTLAIGILFVGGMLTACSGKHNAKGEGAPVAAETTASVSTAPHMPKPGLWTMTVSADGMPRPMTSQMCVGAPVAGTNPFSPPPQAGQAACAKNAVTKTADGYSIESVCTINGMTINTTGEVKGDFASAYTIAMKSRMSGANLPAAMQQERSSTVDAKFGGACPAGMAPGTAKQIG